MTGDRGNVKLPRPDYERHNERRKDMGLTWPEYMDGQAPDHTELIDVDELATTIADEIETRMR